MPRAWPVLAVLLCGMARGAAPSYSAAGVVNSGNYSPAPFAPNSAVTVFGSGLARSTQAITASDIAGHLLPTELNFTQVMVDNSPAPLFYVSDSQINFLVPARQLSGNMSVRVVREGISGPEITLPVTDAAPALFAMAGGFAIATHSDNIRLITPDAPTVPGEVIVVYATGLGRTVRNPATGELPQYVSEIENLATLKVTLGGTVVDAAMIQYAGLTPGSAGLYQINLVFPGGTGANPEIRVAVAGVSSAAGLQIAVK